MNNIEKINQNIHESKQFNYRDKTLVFHEIYCQHGQCRINVTLNNSKTTFVKKEGQELDLWLLALKPIEISEKIINDKDTKSANIITSNEQSGFKVKKPYVPALFEEKKETLQAVANMLLDDIKKVRKNKEYIPQAKQAAHSAQTIINLAKLELDIITKS